MNAPVQLVHDGFGLVLGIALPMLVAALLGVLVAAGVARLVGVQDAASSAVARAAAILVVLVVLGAAWGEQVRGFTAQTWASLGDVGQSRP